MVLLGKCPICKSPVSSDAESCPHCGTSDFEERTSRRLALEPCDKCNGTTLYVVDVRQQNYYVRHFCHTFHNECHDGHVHPIEYSIVDKRTNTVLKRKVRFKEIERIKSNEICWRFQQKHTNYVNLSSHLNNFIYPTYKDALAGTNPIGPTNAYAVKLREEAALEHEINSNTQNIQKRGFFW